MADTWRHVSALLQVLQRLAPVVRRLLLCLTARALLPAVILLLHIMAVLSCCMPRLCVLLH